MYYPPVIMTRLRHPFPALVLAAGFLLLGAVLSSQAVAHAVHHAGHQAATHANPLCTWLCAAGQVLEAGTVSLTGPSSGIFLSDSKCPVTIATLSLRSPLSRAPPPTLLLA